MVAEKRRERRKTDEVCRGIQIFSNGEAPFVPKRDNKLYNVELKEMENVNKTVKIHFVGLTLQLVSFFLVIRV